MSYRSAPRTAARATSCALAVVSLLASLSAQASLAAPQAQPAATLGSPLEPLGTDPATGLPLFAPRADAVSALAALAAPGGRPRVLLQGVALGDGRTATLDLAAIDLERLRFGFQVNGAPAPGLLDGLELSVWTGTVVGEPGSEVLLSLSTRGVWGWVRGGAEGAAEAVHVLSRPTGSDWTAPQVLLARDGQLAERGLSLGDFCAEAELPTPPGFADERPSGRHPTGAPAGAKSGAADAVPDCSHWECGMAIETDFQFYEQFNDLGAGSGYLATLLAAISARYEEQIDTVLVFPYVQLYTTETDPWNAPDVGGNSFDMLIEFQAAWVGAIPNGARLGHMVSGANLGGGVAWVGVLGDDSQTFSFGVSGNVDGDTVFPIVVGPLNWDFMVIAHETGHNFGSPHTHDFLPPLDDCANGACITDGTIMSYCHVCPGGMNNITTFFHPICVEVMQGHAGDFLPLIAPLVAAADSQPTLIPPFTATQLSVQVQGTPIGPVNLNYRYGPGSFIPKPMVDGGGGLWTTGLPASLCGEEPEWFFSTVDAACGGFATPLFGAEVGNHGTLLADDFEIDSGWVTSALGDNATSGIWERGDPIGTGPQPDEDLSEPGSDCFFTGQGTFGGSVGENDIDGGKTTLVSPPIDLSSGDARIGYWRWYSNDAGSAPNSDVFVVEVSNDGLAWVNVETVGPAGEGTGGLWFRHEFTVSDFVTPNASVQVRFIAADEGSGSIVEAAIDELEVFRITCAELCQADIGFGGPGTASLTVCGGDLSVGTKATLSLTGATPGGLALFFASPTFAPTPVMGGTVVPMPPTLRYFLPIDGAGAISVDIPGGFGPLSLYVQAIYQAPLLPDPHWGISNAVRVDLLAGD